MFLMNINDKFIIQIYVPTSVFSHGQLYIVISRVTYLLITIDNEEDNTNVTSNVVYKEFF
jgi:hypothetical protein